MSDKIRVTYLPDSLCKEEVGNMSNMTFRNLDPELGATLTNEQDIVRYNGEIYNADVIEVNNPISAQELAKALLQATKHVCQTQCPLFGHGCNGPGATAALSDDKNAMLVIQYPKHTNPSNN